MEESVQGKRPLRAVFMGTPAFATTVLEAVLASGEVEVAAVYCQPDKPAGRGKAMKMPETKILALEKGLPVQQPLTFKDPAALHTLQGYAPEVLLVAAYGMLLPQAVLDVPRLMPLNVHTSLLPRYRGAAPIQRAVMNGDTVTGVTIMRMEAGLDTGPILMQRAMGIGINDTSATMHDELAAAGGVLLLETLQRLQAGQLTPIEQDNARATHAAKLHKAECRLDLRLPQLRVHALARGLFPWPGVQLCLHREGQENLLVQAEPGTMPFCQEATALFASAPSKAPGTILGVHAGGLVVACADGPYVFGALRPAGKKSMDGQAFMNGYCKAFPGAAFIPPE